MTNEEAIKHLRDAFYSDITNEQREAIYTAVAALERDRWISVEERLPEPNKEVLVYLFGSSPYVSWIDEEGRWETNDFYVDHDYLPKVWMPLPEPPKEDKL